VKELLRESGAERVIERLKGALKGKADSYEIFFSCQKGFGVEAKQGAVDALKVRSSAGVGIRTISKGRLGFAFSSVLEDKVLDELAAKALAASLEASVDKFLRLPEPGAARSEEGLGIFDGSYLDVPEEDKIKKAIEIEKAAMGFDGRVKRIRKASYSESATADRVVNSNGVDAAHAATYFTGSVTAVAEEGKESQMGWEMGMGHSIADVDPDWIGRGAAKNAVRGLGAREIRTVKCGAVIENTVACELLESLASSFLGDNVEKGKSMLIGKEGMRIASSVLNIFDDGIMKGGWASSAHDAEGTPTGRTPLVLEGVCQGFLYDTYWAGRAGKASTANAARGGYKSTPGVGLNNIYIEKGGRSFEELLADLGKGLFITELLGVHTINTVSGDFSLGAAGFWVEGGRLAYPVRGMAVSGNLLGLFSNVGACASDLRFLGSIGAPSLLVNEIEASGT